MQRHFASRGPPVAHMMAIDLGIKLTPRSRVSTETTQDPQEVANYLMQMPGGTVDVG